jgi:hypothetical protein
MGNKVKTIILTRTQIERIHKLLQLDPNLDRVIVEIDSSNGIGPVVKIKYTAELDITEVDTW